MSETHFTWLLRCFFAWAVVIMSFGKPNEAIAQCDAGTLSGSGAVCVGGSITLTSTVDSGTWSSSSIGVASIGTGGVVTGVSGGTARITYTVTGGCGSGFTTLIVTVSTTASAGTISGPSVVNEGETISLSSSVGGGTWSSGNTKVSLAFTGILTGITAGTATITYTASNGCGTASATRTVTVSTSCNTWTSLGPMYLTDTTVRDMDLKMNRYGVPYMLYSYQVGSNLRVAMKKYVGAGWVNVSSTSIIDSDVTWVSLAFDSLGNPYASMRVGSGDDIYLTIRKYDGFNWVVVGPSTAIASNINFGTMATDRNGVLYVAYNINDGMNKITVRKLVGDAWQTVGIPNFTPSAFYPSLRFDSGNTPYIAFIDESASRDGVMKFNGTSWQYVGDSGVADAPSWRYSMAIDIHGTPYMAYIQRLSTSVLNGLVFVKKFSGGTWVSVGDTLIANASRCAIDIYGEVPYVLYNNGSVGKAIVKKFNGTTWTVVGGPAPSLSLRGDCKIAVSDFGIPHIAYPTTITNRLCAQVLTSNVGTITGADQLCVGTTSSYTISATGGSWSSSNTAVVTINSSGSVTAVSQGVAVISYTSGACSAVKLIAVKGPYVVSLSGAGNICAGDSVNLATNVGGGTWISSNSAVASVGSSDAYGSVIIGVSGGTSIISYTATNECATTIGTKVVTVNVIAGSVIGADSICVGNTPTYVVGTPGGEWSSSNVSVITIGSSGTAEGVSTGISIISYTLGACIVIKQVRVDSLVVPTISGASSICEGSTVSLVASGSEGIWTSSDSEVVAITYSAGYNATVTGVGDGTATISYHVSNLCGSITVTTNVVVNAAPDAGVITGGTTICLGTTGTLSSTVSGGTWSCANPIIILDPVTGVFSGTSIGTGIVHYTVSDGCTGNSLTDVTILGTAGVFAGETVVESGANITLSYNLSGGNWSSSDTAVASVNPVSGVVHGVSTGTAIISYNGTNACGVIADAIIITVNPELLTCSVWSQVGAANFTTADPGEYRIANDTSGKPFVVFHDMSDSSRVKVMTYNGSSWVDVGSPLGKGQFESIVVARDGTPYVSFFSYIGSGVNVVKKYNGSNWVDLGTPDSFVTGGRMCLTLDGSDNPTVLFYSSAYDAAVVKQFDGVEWVALGVPGFSDTTILPLDIAYNRSGILYVLFADWSVAAKGTVMKYDGGVWTTVGIPGFTDVFPISASLKITSDGIPYVAVGDFYGRPYVYKYIDTAWEHISVPAEMPYHMENQALVIDNSDNVYLFYEDAGYSDVKKLIGSTWVSSGMGSGGYGGRMSIDKNDAIYVLYPGSAGLSVRKRTAAVPAIGGVPGVCIGGTTTFTDAASAGIWSSSNTAVATVGSSSGIVAGVVSGTTVITYSHGECYATKPITVNVMPSAGTISGTAIMCATGSSSLSNTVSGGSWSTNNAAVATVDAVSGVVTGVASGIATISYGVSNGCATAYATQPVTINAAPNAGSITGAGSVNVGSSITLNNAVSGGSWSASNGNATVSSTGVVVGVSAGSVIISYSVSNSCGTAVATKVITANDDAPTISGTFTVCSGLTTALSASISGGTWSSSNTAVASVGSVNGVVTGVSAGTAAIVYTTATSSATVVVTITAAPSLTGTAALCPGGTTVLSGSGTGGAWTGGSTVVATVGSTGVVTGIAAGTTNITYSIGTGCNATITITVNSAPASITGTFKACPGTTTALSCMTTGGTWSSSDPTIAIADAATGIVTGVTAGTITVTYAAGAGCYRTVTVTINPVPAAIGGSLMICTGSSTSLTDVTPGSSWSSSNTSVATISSTGVVAGVGAGNTTITYTAASTNCITTAVVTVNGVPATIGGPAAGCVGSNITLTNSVAGGAWSSSNTAVAAVDASTGVVTGVTSGMATITYSGGAGCYRTKAISINNSPTVTGYPMACVGLTTTLSGGSSGTWSSSTPSVAAITTSGGYVNGVSAGTSTMTFTSTSTTCPATYVVTVIATPSAITGATIGCQGSTVTLSNSTPGGSWSSNNTAIASVGSATGIVTAVGAGGTATISYSFGNCRVTAPFSPKPLPAVIGGSTSVCTPLTTTLTCTTGGGTWSSSDASVATIGSAISVGNGVVTGVAAGTANMTYTITSTGCARSAMVTVSTGLNPGTITSSGGFTLHTVSAPTSVTLSSTGASGGIWTSSNPAKATIDVSSGVVTAVAAGTTTITYAVTGNCTNITTKNITVTAGRPAASMQSGDGSVQLYPNPTTGAFTLVSEESGVLNVFSIDGREIASYTVTAGISPLNLPREIASGTYMCRYTSDRGNTTMVRLVVE